MQQVEGIQWWHLVLAGALIFGQAGAAWLVLKTMLNGVREDLKDHISQGRVVMRDVQKQIEHRRQREETLSRELVMVKAQLARMEAAMDRLSK